MLTKPLSQSRPSLKGVLGCKNFAPLGVLAGVVFSQEKTSFIGAANP